MPRLLQAAGKAVDNPALALMPAQQADHVIHRLARVHDYRQVMVCSQLQLLGKELSLPSLVNPRSVKIEAAFADRNRLLALEPFIQFAQVRRLMLFDKPRMQTVGSI